MDWCRFMGNGWLEVLWKLITYGIKPKKWTVAAPHYKSTVMDLSNWPKTQWWNKELYESVLSVLSNKLTYLTLEPEYHPSTKTVIISYKKYLNKKITFFLMGSWRTWCFSRLPLVLPTGSLLVQVPPPFGAIIMASNVAPPAGGGGGAAAAVGSAALHAGQRGAAIAQKGVVNLTIYVQRLQKKTREKRGSSCSRYQRFIKQD